MRVVPPIYPPIGELASDSQAITKEVGRRRTVLLPKLATGPRTPSNRQEFRKATIGVAPYGTWPLLATPGSFDAFCSVLSTGSYFPLPILKLLAICANVGAT